MEGRTTRSRRKLVEQATSTAELYLDPSPAKIPHLADSVVLTPPPSQHPPQPSYYSTRNKRRQELENSAHGRYAHSLDGTTSSSSSDPSLMMPSLHSDEYSIGFDMSSIVFNDTFLSASGDDMGESGPSSDLHTPPGSPNMNGDATAMCVRPETPTPRPETPGDINPLTPSEDTEVFDASSLVGPSTMSTYGPPPTPMCPPRVGSLSSSSLCVKLPLSSANSTASASAAPPLNILESDDDDDDDNNERSHVNDVDDVNNITILSVSGTHKNPSCLINSDNNSESTGADMVVSDPRPASTRNSPSPPHSPESLLSKHSHRLRIRAPPPRSCRSSSRSRRKASSPMSSTPSSQGPGGGRKATSTHEVMQRLHFTTKDKSFSSITSIDKSSENKGSKIHSDANSNQCNSPIASQMQGEGRSTRSSSVSATTKSPPVFLKPSLPSPSQIISLRRQSPPKNLEGALPAPVVLSPPKRFLSMSKSPTLPSYLKRPLPTFGQFPSKASKVSINIGPLNESTPATSQAQSPSSSKSSATTRTTSSSSSPPYTEIYKNRRKSEYVRDGILISLKMINFMAHVFFAKTWNRNMNIINGENGTGKSAITTAILLVFGDKAINTQRTSSVKNFIKKGCSEAYIEVRLSNMNGSLSKDKYGEMIILSRRIKGSGSSIYQVECPGGGKRKINVQELAMMAHALQIDPNNPVQFLQQDRVSEVAKSGGSKNPDRERFLKFKQSTQLQTKEEMINQALENINATKESIKVKEKDRKMFALMEQQLRKQCEQIEKLEESEHKIEELNNEFHWAEVKVREEKLQEVREQKEQTLLSIKENDEYKKKVEHEISNFNMKHEKHQKECSSAKQQLDKLYQEREVKESELSERKRTIRRVQSEHTTLLGEIRKFNEELAQLEGKTNEETISYEEHNQKVYLEVQRMNELKETKERQLEDLRLEKDTFFAELNEIKAQIHAGNEAIKKLQYQQNQTNKELNKSKENFGKSMKEVLRLVEKTKGWIIPPVGPVGDYITVPDEHAKYAPIIEHVVHNCLFTFIVQRREDFVKFKAILNEVYDKKNKGRLREKEASVICIDQLNVNEYLSKVRPVKQKLQKLGFRTVLSMVTVKNPVAEVALVEIPKAERTVLFDTNSAAVQIMKDTSKCPPEVVLAYTLDWFRVVPAPRLQFQVLPRIKCTTDIIPMAKVEAVMQIKEKIAREQEIINTCRAHLKGYKDGNIAHPGLERRLQKTDENIQLLNKEIHQLRNRVKQAQSSIKQSNDQDQSKDVASEIDGVLEMRAERERVVQIRLRELELVKSEITRIQNEKEAIESQLPALQNTLEHLEAHQNGAHGSISKLQKEVEGYRIKMNRSEKEFHQLSLQDTKIWDDLNEKMKLATGKRPKILDRDPEEVKRETEDLKTFLQQNSDKLKRKKRVFSEHRNSLQLVEKITDDINWMKDLSDRLEPYIKVGRDCYDKMKRATGVHLKSNFQALVEAHGLTGDLVIDWKKETLVYYVSPDKQADARAKRNYSKQDGETVIADKQGIYNYYSSLSGGERSKALVFYIMSMWKITDLPFHCLDEFEACLDEQSRGSIHETLVKHARNHMDAQFFILTPLDLVGIPRDDPFITIHTLHKKG